MDINNATPIAKLFSPTMAIETELIIYNTNNTINPTHTVKQQIKRILEGTFLVHFLIQEKKIHALVFYIGARFHHF